MRKLVAIGLGAVVVVWIAYTLYAVGRFGGAVVVDVDTTGRIMSVRDDDHIHSAVGLTYHGVGGAALVIAELLLVLAGLACSVFARGWMRVAGLVVLAAWTVLWLGNALWLQSLGWNRRTDVVVLAVMMLVTVVWAALRLIEVPAEAEAD